MAGEWLLGKVLGIEEYIPDSKTLRRAAFVGTIPYNLLTATMKCDEEFSRIMEESERGSFVRDESLIRGNGIGCALLGLEAVGFAGLVLAGHGREALIFLAAVNALDLGYEILRPLVKFRGFAKKELYKILSLKE